MSRSLQKRSLAGVSRQRGVVLIVALVALLILTMFGIVSLRSTGLQERMSRNLRDAGVAMQTSASALREAETYISGLANTTGFVAAPYYASGTAPSPFTASTWQGSASVVAAGNYGSAQTPRYFIEWTGDFMGDAGGNATVFSYGQASSNAVSVFRIVSRGTGVSGTSQVILEEFYGKQF